MLIREQPEQPWAHAHLHLHHLVFAFRAKRPLVRERVVVVGALAAVEADGVTGQLDDLEGATKKPGSHTAPGIGLVS